MIKKTVFCLLYFSVLPGCKIKKSYTKINLGVNQVKSYNR